MKETSRTLICLACLVAVILSCSPSLAQQQQQAQVQPQTPEQNSPGVANVQLLQAPKQQQPHGGQDNVQIAVTPDQAGSQTKGLLMPLVSVDRADNKSKVDVHVPIFFNMLNEKDEKAGKAKLDLSAMSGLVTVNYDKDRDENGTYTGPLLVTVFGIPVYSGIASSKPRSSQEPSANALGRQINSRANEIMSQIQENVRQTNERSLRGLSDLFARIAQSLDAAGIAGRQASEPQVKTRPLDTINLRPQVAG